MTNQTSTYALTRACFFDGFCTNDTGLLKKLLLWSDDHESFTANGFLVEINQPVDVGTTP